LTLGVVSEAAHLRTRNANTGVVAADADERLAVSERQPCRPGLPEIVLTPAADATLWEDTASVPRAKRKLDDIASELDWSGDLTRDGRCIPHLSLPRPPALELRL
jgi:hypothetical protein